MGVTITDASLSTARRRQLCLYAWRTGTGYPTAPTTAKKEQSYGNGGKGVGPSAEVPLNVRVGCLVATQNNGLQGSVRKSPAECSGVNNGGSN